MPGNEAWTGTSTRILVMWLAVAAMPRSPMTAGIKETARLTISGPGLSQPLELVDAKALALSNVFGGAFIGAPATDAPDADLPRYTIVFDIQTTEGIRAAAYTVVYCTNRSTGEGFVYLPGFGEDGFRRNVGTILREGQDGRWHRATAPWSQAINAQLP